MHDAVAREPGSGRELHARRIRHGRANAGEQLHTGGRRAPRAPTRAAGAPNTLNGSSSGVTRVTSARRRQGRDHERQLVGRQRPRAPRRDDDRDALRAAAAQVGDDPVERLGVVRALEADAVLVGRVGEGPDREHEPVVDQLVPGLQVHDPVVALDARDGVVAEAGVEVGRQLGDRIALRASEPERLEHLEGMHREVVLRRDERQRHAAPDEARAARPSSRGRPLPPPATTTRSGRSSG